MVIKLAEACVAPTQPLAYLLLSLINTAQPVAHAEIHKHLPPFSWSSYIMKKVLYIGDHITLFKPVSSDCRLNKPTTHPTQINNGDKNASNGNATN